MPSVCTNNNHRVCLQYILCLLLSLVLLNLQAHETSLPENEEVAHFRQQLMKSIDEGNCVAVLVLFDELKYHKQIMDGHMSYFKGKCLLETGKTKEGIATLNDYIKSSDDKDIYVLAARGLLDAANYKMSPGYLTLKPDPPAAKIRFLNTDLVYADGMKLMPSDYLLEISLPGYLTEHRWLTIEPGQHEFNWPLTLQPDMVPVDAGCIPTQQPKESNETSVTSICVNNFEISKYEVTNAEWDAVMSQRFPPCMDNQQPVSNKSWEKVHAFIERLNFITNEHYRLPTEAEWIYAASAGNPNLYHWGDEVGLNHANCNGCGSYWDNQSAAPVGSFNANQWGIHDMHGNVYEWTCSNYQEPPMYSGQCDSDSIEEASKVIKGGAWNTHHKRLRTSDRIGYSPDVSPLNIGLRLVKDVPSTSNDVVSQHP